MDSWNILCCKPQPRVSRIQRDNISWPQGGALFCTPGEEALNMGVAGRGEKTSKQKGGKMGKLTNCFGSLWQRAPRDRLVWALTLRGVKIDPRRWKGERRKKDSVTEKERKRETAKEQSRKGWQRNKTEANCQGKKSRKDRQTPQFRQDYVRVILCIRKVRGTWLIKEGY